MEPLILTFDIGTQSTRGMLVRKDGSFLDSVKYRYPEPYFSPNPYWAEQKPDFYYNAVCRVSRELLSRNAGHAVDIIAVTVTTIRDTVLCLDKECRPLENIIVWLDKREAEFSREAIPAVNRALFKAVGKYETSEYQYRDSVCNWIKQNDPERWENTAHYVFLPTYLNYLMTGVLADSTGNMIGHMPFDSKKRRWMKTSGLTYPVFAVPEEKLTRLLEPGDTIGPITEECSRETLIPAGIPLIATGSDKGCETLGLSVTGPGKAALSFGTSATIQITTSKYVEPQPLLPAYCAAYPGLYNPEIQIFRGYWMHTWFIEQFCAEEKELAKEQGLTIERYLNLKLEEVPAGCDGLFIQPYWTPGVGIPHGRGSMVGFTDRHNKYYIYRAVIEGINYELMSALKMLEKQSHTPVSELWVGGGGASSPEILQLTADMFGLPVKCTQTPETTTIGASMVGFISAGVFRDLDEASAAMIQTGNVYMPDMEKHSLYEDLFHTYEGIYGGLKRTYKKEHLIYRRRRENG